MTITPQRIGLAPATDLVDRYLERHASTDLEGLMALFARDASVEDPVGSPVHCGSTEIRSFYQQTHRQQGRLVIERVSPALVRGNEIAAHIRARLERDKDAPAVDVIYTIRVGEDGRIASLRAYF